MHVSQQSTELYSIRLLSTSSRVLMVQWKISSGNQIAKCDEKITDEQILIANVLLQVAALVIFCCFVLYQIIYMEH